MIRENLPVDFLKRMESMLPVRYDDFINCYKYLPFKGLRVNTLICPPDRFLEISPFPIKKIPFCRDGFYAEGDGFGNHPYHHAGMYYMQEPSAMYPVEILSPRPGDKVLDLCAAPGGKSTQIAAKLENRGLLVSNEAIAGRAGALVSNIERLGIRNAVVTNMRPDILCEKFHGFFDKILVDAPCSGEGMFRKNPKALLEWSIEHVKACAARQLGILESAKNALKEGGSLVYSTCTFSEEENEDVIHIFLKNNPNFILDGEMCRIYPFDGGEGHFAAKLLKVSGPDIRYNIVKNDRINDVSVFFDFYKEYMCGSIPENIMRKNNSIYIYPGQMPDIKGLNILRSGVFAGQIVNNRFVPAHHFFKSFNVNKSYYVNFALNDERVDLYLRGHEIEYDSDLKGFFVICVQNYILGFGKYSQNRIKNHYPKGLRNINSHVKI